MKNLTRRDPTRGSIPLSRTDLAAAVALALTLPAAAAAQTALDPVRGPSTTRWSWKGPAPARGAISIDLARGDVTLLASSGPEVEIEVVAADPEGDGSPAGFRIATETGSLRLVDVYPAASPWLRECLPPEGEHGGFMSYPQAVRVTGRVPATLGIDARVMAGSVVDRRPRRAG